jgi:glycerol uptake facilitator protein
MITRRKIAMLVAELLGTGVLTLVFLSVSRSAMGYPYFVAIAAGLAVAMAWMVFSTVSGAHLNPIVTLGMWSVRRVKTLPAIAYIAAQVLGAIGAYYLFTYIFGQKLPETTAEFQGKTLVAEAVGALVFSLGWATVVYRRLEGAKAAGVIAISLMLGMMIAAAGQGGIVNPALAYGAQSLVWGTFVLGPVLGAIIGFNLYGLLFAPAKELVASLETAEDKAADKAAAKVAKVTKK